MNTLKQLSALLFSVLLFSGFSPDQKLNQKEVANTIYWFRVSQGGHEDLAEWFWEVVLLEEVKIDPIKQSSEKEATCTAVLEAEIAVGDPTKDCNYVPTTLTIEFHFQKNKENKWILEGINKCASSIKVNENHLMKFIEKNRNLNIAVE